MDEVAQHLVLTEAEVRAALDTLARLHLLRRSPHEPDRLSPVDPNVSLGALLVKREGELSRHQRQLESARRTIAAIADEYGYRREYLPEIVERLDDLEAVRQRLVDLAENAREECLSFLPGGAQKPDTMDASKPLDQLALERGVSLRSIYQDSFRNDAATTQYARWLATLGGESRTVPALPMLLVVVDRRVALVPLDPQDGRRGALVLHSAGAVTAMTALFEQVWRTATPWQDAAPRNLHGLTPQERELLCLLAEGCIDEVVARRLGVSLRTIRRMTSDLTTRLHARSRFEAGVRAVRQGWI